MKVAESYRRASPEESWDAIVVGSGMGGLAAGALLAKHGGRRVLVLERHYALGGFTHTFRRPGYEWDVGVHYIGDVRPGTMLRALFDEVSGGALAWADMGAVYDRVVLGDFRFEFPKGRERLRTRLKDAFPAESVAVDRYFELLERTEAATRTCFMEKALPAPLAAVAGPFLRWPFLRRARRTTRDVLESLTDDRLLIGVLTSQWGDYGLPPGLSSFGMHAVVASHHLEGGFYPVGGAGRIAETVMPVIHRAGGRALIRAEVDGVIVEDGRAVGVRMAGDGRLLRAPVVVSDVGVANTFRRLLPPETAGGLGVLDRLDALRPSMAHLCLYVGLDGTAEQLYLPRANLWIYPDEHHDRSYAAMQRGDERRPFVYVSFPSAKDPEFERRHPGRATIDVITGAPWEAFVPWEGTRWKKRGGRLRGGQGAPGLPAPRRPHGTRAADPRSHRHLGALDAPHHAPLLQLRARGDLRPRPHAPTLRAAVAPPADRAAGPVAHRPGRDHLRGRGSPDRRCSLRVGGPGPEPHREDRTRPGDTRPPDPGTDRGRTGGD